MTSNEETRLINSIKSLEDYEETSKNLMKLMEINPNKALLYAEDILSNRKGDEYLQASAFDTLYSLDINRAMTFTKNNINEIDVYLLGTIINNVTADSGIINKNPIIKNFVSYIKEFLSNKRLLDFERIKDDIDWFNITYST